MSPHENPSGTESIEAATVILIRDSDAGVEVLMVERNPDIHFGGMWVFPGGRVDEADWQGIDRSAPNAGHDAAKVAAVRETAEEAGLASEAGSFVTHSHWLPPMRKGRRYSTWFFIAAAPVGEVTTDDGEITNHRWVTPTDALTARDEGRIELVPPTWVTLHRLTAAGSVAEALREAADREPPFFVTTLVNGAYAPVAVWEPDAAYHSGDLEAEGPRRRLVMASSGWHWDGAAP